MSSSGARRKPPLFGEAAVPPTTSATAMSSVCGATRSGSATVGRPAQARIRAPRATSISSETTTSASVFHPRKRHAVRPLRLDLDENGARALRVARALETGVLSINSNSSVRVSTPFGGFKQSGFGRELGLHGLDGYSELKNVYYSTEG